MTNKPIKVACGFLKKTLRHIATGSLFVILLIVTTKYAGAVCSECPTGWAPCGANQCCIGGSCPSYKCGACNVDGRTGTWNWFEDLQLSYCVIDHVLVLGCDAGCGGCGGASEPPARAQYIGYFYEDANGNNAFDPAIDYTWGPDTLHCPGSKVKLKNGLVHYVRGPKVDGEWTYNFSGWECDADGNPQFNHGNLDLTWITFRLGGEGITNCDQIEWAANTWSEHALEYGFANFQCKIDVYPRVAESLKMYIKVGDAGPAPRQVTGTLSEVTDPAACTQTGNLGLTGLRTQLYDDTPTTIGSPANVDVATGNYAITDVNSLSIFTKLGVLGTLNRVDKAYKLACVRPSAGTNCTLNLGAGTILNCTPSNSLSTGNVNINLGFTKINNEKWFTTTDGDFFAEDINTYVAEAPSGGFAPYIANAKGTLSSYGFSNGTIETQTATSGVSETGGAAQDLGTDPNLKFNDKWLQGFNFTPPHDTQTHVPGNKNFAEGKVYSLTVSEFNQIIEGGNYKVIAANTGDKATAVVYVTGTDPIIINNSFVSDDPANQVLIVVTDTNVEISSDVTWPDVTTYTLDNVSQLDLALISAKDIIINSRYDADANIADNPIKINGTLMAKGGIRLNRDLGNLNNSLVPAENVTYFPYLHSLIQKYELENTDILNYTGLTTYDVQYVYRE